MRIAQTAVQYKIILPDVYDPESVYPAVVVLGGGPQTMRTIDSVLNRGFRRLAETLGYIVVAPAAPDGDLFFREGSRIFPAFLDTILQEFQIRNNRFHIAGPSNGGIAAFHIAALNPEYFISVTAYPGYMWQPTSAKLDAISHMCVFAYIGENDTYGWHEEMQREIEYLSSRGTLARYSLEENQPHRLATLAGANAARLFNNFALTDEGCRQ